MDEDFIKALRFLIPAGLIAWALIVLTVLGILSMSKAHADELDTRRSEALVNELTAAGKRQAELMKIDADSIGLLQMRLANALDEIDALRAQVFWLKL
jgi:hypothetical protein